jgi:hypothetical protein
MAKSNLTFGFLAALAFLGALGLTKLVQKMDKSQVMPMFVESSSESASTQSQASELKSQIKTSEQALSDQGQGARSQSKAIAVKKKAQKRLAVSELKIDAETASSDPQQSAQLRDALTDLDNEHSGITKKLDSKSFEKSAF